MPGPSSHLRSACPDGLAPSTSRRDRPGIWLHATLISGIAFLLHAGWEAGQCRWFYVHREHGPFVTTMLAATGGDVLLTWVAQVAVAAARRDWFWCLRRWGPIGWATLEGAAVVLSVLVEVWGLSTGRWTYTAANPLVPGTPVSAIPVVQLLVLFPLTFGLVRWVATRRAWRRSAGEAHPD